jgi:uncharacterized protein (DUF427 family)
MDRLNRAAACRMVLSIVWGILRIANGVPTLPEYSNARSVRERPDDFRHSLPLKEPPMTEKPIRIPGPDHPITVEPTGGRVVVRLGGRVIADTADALTLREAAYPPVLYIPRKDVDMAALERSDHGSYCPYKGEASYFSIPEGGERSVNAIWTYEAPYDAVAAIRDHLAFYPDRVDAIEIGSF